MKHYENTHTVFFQTFQITPPLNVPVLNMVYSAGIYVYMILYVSS